MEPAMALTNSSVFWSIQACFGSPGHRGPWVVGPGWGDPYVACRSGGLPEAGWGAAALRIGGAIDMRARFGMQGADLIRARQES